MTQRDKIEINEESIWQLDNPEWTLKGILQIISAILVGILAACIIFF